ncbi:MAG: type 4a pilus biogenesis protein PilO [Actinomycetota bacterium]
MSRRGLIITALACVAIIGLWWVFLFSPAGDDLAAAEERRDGAETQLNTLLQQRDRLSLLVEQRPFFQSELESLRAAIPEQPDLAGVLLSIDEAARASGVTFLNFSASEPVSTDAFGLSPVTIQINGDGGYFQVLDFLNRLNRIHRIVVVDQLNLAAESGEDLGPPRLVWTIGLTTFVSGGGGAGDPAAEVATDAPAEGAPTEESGGVE